MNQRHNRHDPPRRRAAAVFSVLCLLTASLATGATRDERLSRTRRALHELAHLYAQAEPLGRANLYHAVPLLAGEIALGDLALAAAEEQGQILDHVYERCLRARTAILVNIERGRQASPLPPAVPLDELRLAPRGGLYDDGLVLPVAREPGEHLVASRWPAGPFAAGAFVRHLPALNGALPGAEDPEEVIEVYKDDPTARRVGWRAPAGGFLRDARGDRPAVLIQIDHPNVREAIAKATIRAATDAQAGPKPLYYSLGADPFYVDYSSRSAERFERWLKAQHETLGAVNAVWGTRYEAFQAAMMPRRHEAGASPSRWRDWVAFNQWRLTQHIRWAAGTARRLMPQARLGLAMVRYLLAGSHGLSGTDPAAAADALDVIEANGADVMETDLLAAFAGAERPLVDAALGAGPFGVLPHFLHGCAAVQVRPWPVIASDGLQHAERALRETLDARRLGAAIRELASAPQAVALLYSEAALRLPEPRAVRCGETPNIRRLRGAYQGARFLVEGCGFVTTDDLLAKRVATGRLLVVAGSRAERESVVRALMARVETGGHVLVLAGSLLSDERGHEADYLLRLGIEVRHTARPTYTVRDRPDRGGALDELVATDVPAAEIVPASDGPLAGLPPLRGRGLRKTLRVNVVHDTLATFSDGSPAIVSFPRGDGRVTYLAMPLVPQDFAAVLGRLLRQGGEAEPLVRLAPAGEPDAWGIECRAVRRGRQLLAYAWNTTDQKRRVSFHTGAASAATDLSRERNLAIRRDHGRVVVESIELRPFETVLVQFALP
jgi:hypothetical protein